MEIKSVSAWKRSNGILSQIADTLFITHTNSSIYLGVLLDDFTKNDTLVIKEDIKIISCFGGQIGTVYDFYQSCKNDTRPCRPLGGYTNGQDRISITYGRPYITYKFMGGDISCPYKDSTVVKLKLTNSGDGVMTSFWLVNDDNAFGFANPNPYYKTASSFVYYKDSLFLNEIPKISASFSSVIYALLPGESMYLRATVFNDAPCSNVSSNTNSIIAYNYNVYTDFCGNGNGNNTDDYINLPKDFIGISLRSYMSQFWENHDPTFAIPNNVASLTRDFKVLTTVPFNTYSYGSYYDGRQVQTTYYDPKIARFVVELKLDSGLFAAENRFFLENKYQLMPEKIVKKYGGITDNGYGDVVQAYFQLPDSFFVRSEYMDTLPIGQTSYSRKWKLGPAFYRFFNNDMEVKFGIGATCAKVGIKSGGIAKAVQNIYFLPDPSCNRCFVPISSVSDKFQINCPGCQLPGLNIQAHNLRRINMRYKDNNEDWLPDSLPLQKQSNYQYKRAMLGDTISLYAQAFASTGDVTFNDIKFDFKYARLQVMTKVVPALSFLGANISITTDGLTSSCQVPSSYFSNINGIANLDLSLSSLAMLGFDTLKVRKFNSSTSITINNALFLVVKNFADYMTNRSDASNLVVVEDWVSRIDIAGKAFDAIMSDASEQSPSFLQSAPREEQIKYFYWCTGYNDRFTAVGNSIFTHYEYNSSGCDICNQLQTKAYKLTDGFHQWELYYQTFGRISTNPFPKEYYDGARIDSIKFKLPPYLEFSSLNLGSYLTNTWIYDGIVKTSNQVHVSSDGTYTIDLRNSYKHITSSSLINAADSSYSYWKPSEYRGFNLYAKHKNYKKASDNDVFLRADYPTTLYFSKYPYKIEVAPGDNFRKFKVDSYTLSVQNSTVNISSQYFDIQSFVRSSSTQGGFNLPNNFTYIYSQDNKFKLKSVNGGA